MLPVANAQSVTTAEDASVAITLSGTDVDGDALTYTVVSGPANGTLSGTAPALTYTPTPTTTGRTASPSRSTTGTADSAVAAVSVTVTPVNDPPVGEHAGGDHGRRHGHRHHPERLGYRRRRADLSASSPRRPRHAEWHSAEPDLHPGRQLPTARTASPSRSTTAGRLGRGDGEHHGHAGQRCAGGECPVGDDSAKTRPWPSP